MDVGHTLFKPGISAQLQADHITIFFILSISITQEGPQVKIPWEKKKKIDNFQNS